LPISPLFKNSLILLILFLFYDSLIYLLAI